MKPIPKKNLINVLLKEIYEYTYLYDILSFNKHDYNNTHTFLLHSFDEIYFFGIQKIPFTVALKDNFIIIKSANVNELKYHYQGIGDYYKYTIPIDDISSVESIDDTMYYKKNKLLILNMKNSNKFILVFKKGNLLESEKIYNKLHSMFN